MPKVVIVGNPNVGKSVIFNYLTGAYVTVSNYPGTTVEVSRGKCRISGVEFEVVDTPGMYSLLPITEEERVARHILLSEHPELVLHVVDARNLDRMLPLTLQLIEAGLPVALVVNVLDEAERAGIALDLGGLSARLGIPVVGTVAATGRGMKDLLRLVYAGRCPAQAACPAGQGDPLTAAAGRKSGCGRRCSTCPHAAGVAEGLVRPQPSRLSEQVYRPALKEWIAQVAASLKADYRLSRRAIALLLLQGDHEVAELVRKSEPPQSWRAIQGMLKRASDAFAEPLPYVVALDRQAALRPVVSAVMRLPTSTGPTLADRLSALTMRPLTGIPLLLLVLYFGLYQFVGVFGAGTVVDFLEEVVFGRYLLPPVSVLVRHLIPWPVWQDLVIGEYGLLTLGVRYAVAIILPIVGTFFLFFSVAEDSGYFPRLAMLVDKVFKRLGLNGRAVIPMVLGFGCDTMATMTTRILETRRERLIATFLLALAVPCSAQLGVILSLLAGKPLAMAVWAGVVLGVFLLVGWLTARLLPGSEPSFYMELPPLRLPKLSNVLAKTWARMKWYFLEVFPIFLLASALIWLGRLTGLFGWLVGLLAPVVQALGLPRDTAVVFLFGFFRRDYGAAGLFDLARSGGLTVQQLAVAAVTLTIFIPCIAQFSVMLKERGVKAALAMAGFIFPFAFLVGYTVNWVWTAVAALLAP
ncbi:MAG: ferrous iron transport protein B [Bacillota bacterium]|nr:ferrous iron transport protein B [Bacillota bacterium]